LRERFAIPCDGRVARLIIVTPRCAAVSITAWYVVVCPAWLLRRCVESDVTDVDSSA
jgi:hypothetical protein